MAVSDRQTVSSDLARSASSAGDWPAGVKPVRVLRPEYWQLPLVVASPHSGRHYPGTFRSQTRLARNRLRSTEDSFIDEIFAAAPDLGAPLLLAQFPRVFVDVNRDAFELDPDMFDDPLPDYVTTRNTRISAGLGTIPKMVSATEPVYIDKLRFETATRRIESCYLPYHQALGTLLQEARIRFGFCVLLDCHSMPSEAARHSQPDAEGNSRIDVALGDCHATSCDPSVTAEAEKLLGTLGYAVSRNKPYAGGFVTRTYGRPASGIHAMQIELNRGLYMDERRVRRRRADIAALADDMRQLIRKLGTLRTLSEPVAIAAE